MIYLEILFIAISVVCIVEYCDLYKVILQRLKLWFRPFNCTVCLTFWISLIYTLIQQNLGIVVLGYILLIANLTPGLIKLINFIDD